MDSSCSKVVHAVRVQPVRRSNPQGLTSWWDTGCVSSREFNGYCSYTKAIEHLGDRWSLLIVRELGTFGPQGFNDLVTGLPGRISRSVLADRLRRLETLGVVSRAERLTRTRPTASPVSVTA